MALSAHGTSTTTTPAGAGGFSLLLISDHFEDDQGAYGEDDERDENGGEI